MKVQNSRLLVLASVGALLLATVACRAAEKPCSAQETQSEVIGIIKEHPPLVPFQVPNLNRNARQIEVSLDVIRTTETTEFKTTCKAIASITHDLPGDEAAAASPRATQHNILYTVERTDAGKLYVELQYLK